MGGAFDNPRVRDPKKQEQFKEELKWADYVLDRAIQSNETMADGGWLKIFGIGVSTSRAATFLSVGASAFAFIGFELTNWIITKLATPGRGADGRVPRGQSQRVAGMICAPVWEREY